MPYLDNPSIQDIAPAPESRFPGSAFVCQETRSVGAQGRSQTGPEAANAESLGKHAKSVDQKQKRKERYRLQRRASRLLPDERVSNCKWAVTSKAAGVDVVLNSYERDVGAPIEQASFQGLQTCGSVWLCPCCSHRISLKRKGELNHLLAWAKKNEFVAVMLTLTTRHQRADDLGEQLAAMKKAKQRMRQRREWRRIKDRIVGTVTATEVTHGVAGWHTHFHEIVLVRADSEEQAIALFDEMPRVWRSCLRGFGLDATLKAGFTVQGAEAAGGYVTKWGAGEEVTFGAQKRGRDKGRTPIQLLADADDGDIQAGHLWREYGLTFKGARQLVWSPGLKEAAGVDEVSDEAAAEDEAQAGQEQELVSWIDYETWKRRGRYQRVEILEAAELIGDEGVWQVLAEPEPPDPGSEREPEFEHYPPL